MASAIGAWTAASAGDRAQFSGFPDYYAELATGFLHGELSIPTPAPKALLELPDPYDPTENHPFQAEFGDLALYHGRFYLDWGPAPVVVLYLPWHLLGLGAPSGNLAVFLFCEVGLLAALVLFSELVDTFLPKAKDLSVVAAAAALAFSSVVPFIERQPDTYEVAVASGYCFTMLGLVVIARAFIGGRLDRRRLGLGSLFLGLALASRQDLLVLVVVPLALLVHLERRRRADDLGREGGQLARNALALLGPLLVVVALLAWYNAARFGNPAQIGVSYQLTGVNPQLTPHYQLAYVLPSLYFYVLSPLHFSASFPFITIPLPTAPFALPAHYSGAIRTGLIWETPLVLALVTLPLLRRRVPRPFVAICTTGVVTGLLVMLAIAVSIPGGEERYEVDFSTLLLMPALLCWLAWSPRRRVGRLAIRIAGPALIAYGVLVGLAISIVGYNDQLPQTEPAIYRHLVSATAGIGDLIAKVLGHPVLTAIEHSAGATTEARWDSFGIGSVDYLNINGNPAALEVVVPSSGWYQIDLSLGPGPSYRLAKGGPITIDVRGSRGLEQFGYTAGTSALPVYLVGGDDSIALSATVPGVPVPASESVLSASNLTIAKY